MEKITKKVKALLDKANDAAATQAEAESAMAKAFELLAEHNISMGDLEKGEGAQDVAVGDYAWNQYWQKTVWTAIGHLYFCVFTYHKSGTSPCTYFLCGREANRVTAQAVSEYVVSVGKELALKHAQENEGNSVSLSNNFKKGFALAIRQKAWELFEKAQRGEVEHGNALMVLDVYKQTKIENDELVGHIKGKDNLGDVNNPEAARAGFKAGKTVSLSPQLGGQTEVLKIGEVK